jgi:hypothetical protein
MDKAVKLLDATLTEEKNTDKALTELAETLVNQEAEAATPSDLTRRPLGKMRHVKARPPQLLECVSRALEDVGSRPPAPAAVRAA